MAPDTDMNAAKGTYDGFIKLVKRGSVFAAIVTALVVMIIAS